MAWSEFTGKDNQYMSPEFETFFEKYCQENGTTIKKVTSDADHFDLVCVLFDESLKDKQ